LDSTELLGFIGAIVLVAAFVVLGISIRRRRQLAAVTRQQTFLQRAADHLAGALAAAPGGFLIVAGQELLCSPSLALMLGRAGSDRIDLDSLLGAFAQPDAARLKADIETLTTSGTPFRIEIETAQGRRLAAAGDREARPKAGPAIIWFADVTDERRAAAAVAAELAEIKRSLAQMTAERAAHDAAAARKAADLTRKFETADAAASLYRDIVMALPIPIWWRDADLKVAGGNSAYARSVDADRIELAVNESREIAAGALPDRGRALAVKVLGGQKAESAAIRVAIGGERRFLEVTEAPLAERTQLGYAFDVSEHTETKAEFARHIQAHGVVLENLATAVAIFGADQRLMFHNTAFARLFRYDDTFLKTNPSLVELLEEARSRRRLPEVTDFRAYRQGQVRLFTSLIEPIEELMHLPDGATLRCRIVPHPLGGLLFQYEDVTDRLKLESSYNTLIAVQRATLDNLRQAVAVFGSDGRLKLFNSAFARVWNLPAEDLAAEPHMTAFTEVMERALPADVAGKMRERLLGELTERATSSGRMTRADGVVLDYSLVPLPDGNTLATFADVTDSYRVERALRERNEALEDADRLKTQFLANVSYELRTPLNTIIGFSEILTHKYFGELNQRQMEYGQGIIEASQRLLSLIDDILDLATIEAGFLELNLTEVSVAKLIEGVHGMLTPWARTQDIIFEVDVPTRIGSLIGDERRLRQAMFNVASNAIHYTPPGGRVKVAARREEGELLFIVSDTGVGIPESEQARMFEPFWRPGRGGRQTGAGLGLSLVKSIVQLHGGHVSIDSRPNEGTRITCHLPLRPPVERGLEQAASAD
jgi:signal transduction histidine kinase